MKKVVVAILVLSALAGCEGAPSSGSMYSSEPTINGDIYMGSRGTYGRVGISNGNFGINIGI